MHDHMVVLQRNTTEFRWRTIIEDIEVFTQVHGLDPKHRLLFLEQVNQWLSVLGTRIEWRLQVSRLQNTSHVCMTDLGWFQRKQNNLSQIHGGIFHQMHVYKRKSLLSSTNTSWASMKKMLSKVSNTGLMFNNIMEEIRMLPMGSTTILPGFPLKGIP